MSALSRLRDQMHVIQEASEMDELAGSVKDTGGVYFVTAFSGLLAPWVVDLNTRLKLNHVYQLLGPMRCRSRLIPINRLH